MKEEELAAYVVEWLEQQHWDVYQEVRVHRQWGKVIDIIAVRSGVYWAIECKTSLSLSVLEQASNHNYVNYRSIAVPSARESRSRLFAHDVALKYDIGILTITDHLVNESIPAKKLNHNTDIIEAAISKGQKHSRKAGSKDGKLWTPYRETMIAIKRILREHPGLTIKEIVEDHLGKHHYSNDYCAKSNLRQALVDFEADWCVLRREGNKFKFYLKGGA